MFCVFKCNYSAVTSYRNDDQMSSEIIILNTIVDINGIKSVIVCTEIRLVVVYNILIITQKSQTY